MFLIVTWLSAVKGAFFWVWGFSEVTCSQRCSLVSLYFLGVMGGSRTELEGWIFEHSLGTRI